MSVSVLDPETDIMDQFLDPETDIMGERTFMKSRKKLSMFLLPYDNLPLSFESSGYIDQNYTGRVMIRLGNFTHKKIRLSGGTPIAYIAMSSFSIE